MLENFPVYFKSERQKFFSIFRELKLFQLKKSNYSRYVMQYALLLRYTSLLSYRLLLEQIGIVSFAINGLLNKLKEGKLDSFSVANLLREYGIISQHVILLFDKFCSMKCTEFSRKLIEMNSDNRSCAKYPLSKYPMPLSICNIKVSRKAVPFVKLEINWLKTEILNCI